MIIARQKNFLLLLFVFAFVVRALFFGLFMSKDSNYRTYDSDVYHTVARQLSSGHGYSNVDGSPNFYRVPGYSLFLAACYKIFGLDIKKALWVQVVFASFIPLLIFYLSLAMFPANMLLAKVASLFSALLHVGFILFAGYAMTETFFVIFFLLFLILFWSQIHLFFAGIFLGVASLVRPVGHYLIILSLFLILFSNIVFSRKVKFSLSLFTGWLLVVFGWLLRNWLLTGFVFFHTLGGIHFLKNTAVRVAIHLDNSSNDCALNRVSLDMEDVVAQKEKDLGRSVTQIEHCVLAEKLSFEYMKKDPMFTLRHFLINMFKTSFSLYSAELLYIDSGGHLPSYQDRRNLIGMLSRFLLPKVNNKFLLPIIYLEIVLFLFILLGFAGFIITSLLAKTYLCLLTKTLSFIFLFIVISLACGFARLRLPIEPFLLILSFKFWINIFLRRKSSA